MSSWDTRFSDLATLLSSWSKDPGAKVGAVIVDANKRVVSTGFNGFPRGIKDTYGDRGEKLRRTIHAEVNAILFAGCDLTGMTLYSTHHPCGHCAAVIIQSGITRVVCPKPEVTDLSAHWLEEMATARVLFNEAGVEND
jgi:dCMP deaminase